MENHSTPLALPRSQEDETNPLTVKYLRREMRMISIAEHELDGLASSNASLYLTFLGVGLGSCIALTSTIFSVNIGDPVIHATFVGADIISVGASVLFSILAGKAIRETRRKLEELKSGN